jgi:hypothetical protein
MKPGVKSPTSDRLGIAIASWLFQAIVVRSTLSIKSSVRPAFTPATSASVDAAPSACASRLFRSFIVCPAPSSPQWKKSVPMQSSNGRQRAITSAGPPTISVSVPATAASAVLPTGLSIISAPFSRIRAPTRRVVSGSIVLMSM